MNILTRLWTQGRCCGLSKVQKLISTAFLVWAKPLRASGAEAAAAPRPATPIPRTTSRRVGIPVANLFIVSSPNVLFGLLSFLLDRLALLFGAPFHSPRDLGLNLS